MVFALIPAAGRGARMGGVKKPYIEIAGIPILALTVRKFQDCPLIEGIVLVVAKEDVERCRCEIVERFGFDKVVAIVPGGATRRKSVFNGLKTVEGMANLVVIHDGVRPFASFDLIKRCLEEGRKWGAATAAVPVKDTIKEGDEKGFAVKTLDRNRLWAIQTPQVFKFDLIMEAHRLAERDEIEATDDARLVERMGVKVKLVMGSYQNIKITTPEDLIIAEAILKRCSGSA